MIDTIKLDVSELEVLAAFKEKMPSYDANQNISPFDQAVARLNEGHALFHVEDLHSEVRFRIRNLITQVSSGAKKSEVILVAGQAGSGKTHLLNSFRSTDLSEELGYIFVGGSNHWKINEFESRLLDWMIEAVTAPSPNQDHLLLERIRAMAFRAFEIALQNPITWKTVLKKSPLKVLGKIWHKWRLPSRTKFELMTKNRDPQLFQFLDYVSFSELVCNRFLAERSNLLHRYTLKVLLLYLFPEEPETGIGTKDRVLHWLRGKGDNAYFQARLGSKEQPNQSYSRMEAIKLIVHLFSSNVAHELSTEEIEVRSKAFLITFDQTEGRNELFDSTDEWKDFFAHLSELYNSVQNIIVLFTMTIPLRKALHSSMERQFQDRIRMDDQFQLNEPDSNLLQVIYANRIKSWLKHDVTTSQKYLTLGNPYVPFSASTLTEQSKRDQTIRFYLQYWDETFKETIRKLVVGPKLDYLYERNEIRSKADAAEDYAFTEKHLHTFRKVIVELLEYAGTQDLRLQPNDVAYEENTPILRLKTERINPYRSVVVTVARLGFNFKNSGRMMIEKCLVRRWSSRNFLVLVRPTNMGSTDFIPDNYREQILLATCPATTESTLQALLAVNVNRQHYAAMPDGEAQIASLNELIRSELNRTYLKDFFEFCQSKLAVAVQEGDEVPETAALDGENA